MSGNQSGPKFVQRLYKRSMSEQFLPIAKFKGKNSVSQKKKIKSKGKNKKKRRTKLSKLDSDSQNHPCDESSQQDEIKEERKLFYVDISSPNFEPINDSSSNINSQQNNKPSPPSPTHDQAHSEFLQKLHALKTHSNPPTQTPPTPQSPSPVPSAPLRPVNSLPKSPKISPVPRPVLSPPSSAHSKGGDNSEQSCSSGQEEEGSGKKEIEEGFGEGVEGLSVPDILYDIEDMERGFVRFVNDTFS